MITRVMMYLFLIVDLIDIHAELIMPLPLKPLFLLVVLISYAVNIYWASLIVGALFKLEGKVGRREGPTLTINREKRAADQQKKTA